MAVDISQFPGINGTSPLDIAQLLKRVMETYHVVDIREISFRHSIPTNYLHAMCQQYFEWKKTGDEKYTETDTCTATAREEQLRMTRQQLEMAQRLSISPTMIGSRSILNGWLSSGSLEEMAEWDGSDKPKKEKKAKPEKPKYNKALFDTVILPAEIKEQILAAISQIEHKDLIFDKWGFKDVFEKGTAVSLLFYGLPGTGKTLMAQAIADYLDYELKIYGTAEIQSSEPGGAERAIKKIFEEANALMAKMTGKRQLILLDECDSLLSSRANSGSILAAQINTLLGEIERYAGVIIFTTNRLGKLDEALERRISAKIEFPFPDEQAREKIWERMIPKKAPISKDVHFNKLATIPIAGGNIKNVVLNAARLAAYENSKEITQEHFKKAIKKEAESIESFKQTAQEDLKEGNFVRGYNSQEVAGFGGNQLQLQEHVEEEIKEVSSAKNQ